MAQTLHDLVAAVVTWSDEHCSPGVFDLFGLHPAVVDALLGIGHGPGATAGAAAVVINRGGIRLHKIIYTLLGNPARLLVIAVTEGPLALAPVIARVMIRGQFRVFRFVQLDATGFNVFFEQIVNADKLDTLISEPILQTKPGRKVGVASLR